MATLNLTRAQAREIVSGDSPVYEVVSDEITDHSRWSVHSRCVFRDPADGILYGLGYSRGATESQDETPFEYDREPIIAREMVEVMVPSYEWKKE